jgi:hypothetical protein
VAIDFSLDQAYFSLDGTTKHRLNSIARRR